MKILFIGFTKLKYMPYLKTLFENMKGNNITKAVLYWNRDLQDDVTAPYKDATLYEFKCFQEDDVEKQKKILSMFKYRKYAKNIIRAYQPDKIVVMHSLPAILICDDLLGKYKGRFLFDFRDTTYEKYGLFRLVEERIIKASFITFLSSDGFRCYFNDSLNNKLITTHNLQSDLPNRINYYCKQNVPIKIGYWGFIRNECLNKALISRISSDKRFELHYFGREQQVANNLKQFTSDLNATNIFFHGEYSPAERLEFLKSIAITHNLFDDKNMMIAMPNKYYDSLLYGIPQICMNGSFMGKCAKNAQIGLETNPYDDSFTDDLWNYYTSLNSDVLREKCERELYRVLNQNKIMINELINFCQS